MSERRPRSRQHPSRISVEEICDDMGLGPTRVYYMLEKGIIPNVKIGRNYIVARYAYEGWKKTCGQATTASGKEIAGTAFVA